MFHSNRLYLFIAAVVLSCLFLASCSDDDPVALVNKPDSTAPEILRTDPVSGDPSVAADKSITIFFSERMDTTSVTDQVLLGPGPITSLAWTDNDNTLQVNHDDWNQGDMVTLTVFTGLRDVAGNALKQQQTISFHVFPEDVLAEGSFPAAGAIEVPLNTPVNVQFNRDMDEASLQTGITMTESGKGEIPFTVQATGSHTYALVREYDFTADTEVTVVVGTGCTSTTELGSEPLAQEFTFGFRTGAEADMTPPRILSITPASGSIIPVTTSELVIVFDEPIATGKRMGLSRMNLQFVWAMENSDTQPSFNSDNTVLTVGLATPLPDGIPLIFDIAGFQDYYGNVNDTLFPWETTVAGTADHFPVQDEYYSGYYTAWETIGPRQAKGGGSGHYTMWQKFEWEDDTHFRLYESLDYKVWDEWDYMTKTDSAIMLRGFREMEGSLPVEHMFDTPAKYLNHPTVTDNWIGTVNIVGDEGTTAVEYSVRVLEGTTDIIMGDLRKSDCFWAGMNNEKGIETFWSDCRTVILGHEARFESQLVETGLDTFYLTPGFGMVEFGSWLEDIETGWQYRRHGVANKSRLPYQPK